MLLIIRKAITIIVSEAPKSMCFNSSYMYLGELRTFFMVSELQVWCTTHSKLATKSLDKESAF